MNCPRCGQPVEAGATFCGNCGQPLAQPSPAQTVQPTAAPMPMPTPPPVSQTIGGIIPPTSPGQAGVAAAAPMPMPVPTPGAMPMPMPQPAMAPVPVNASAYEKKAMLGLILGVIGIPGAIIPFLGLVLGIIAVILGTIARRQYKHLMSLLAIIFGILAILLSLAAYAYAFQHDPKFHVTKTATVTSTTKTASAATAHTVETTCYTVKLDDGLSNYTPSGCDLSSIGNTEVVAIEADDISGLSSANFEASAQQVIANVAKGASNGTVVSTQAATFANSPAYNAQISSVSSSSVKVTTNLYVVMHSAPSGENLFLIALAVPGDQKPSMATLESSWQWK
ncbi:MAG TPA: zinc ribbon domain-containing protein [Candidatus Binatia bacterium]|nr:zinc ribbon domain-containing protein [Candidatus Binatia bacterium]